MLYDLWRQVVAECSSDRAVFDSETNRWLSFSELDVQAGKVSTGSDRIVFGSGNNVSFLLQVVAAWRDGKVLCPLDSNFPVGIQFSIPSEVVHLKTTSATTGLPKFVGFTGGQLFADLQQITSTMRLNRDLPNLGAISLAHSYGFSNLVLPLLLKGIPLILSSPFPEAVKESMQQARRCAIPAVPALWNTWFQAGILDPNKIALAISAGAPLPLSLEQSIHQQTGIKVHNFMGSTECGGIAYDRTSLPRKNSETVGSAMDHVKLSLNSEGFLEVESAAVGSGYLPDPKPELQGGKFVTSDLAQIEAGNLRLLGRGDDVINMAGKKIGPAVIEAKMQLYPGVTDCLVFAVEDNDRNQRIIACAASQKKDLNVPELRAFLSQHLEAWQIPREIFLSEDLPVNQRGKRSRKEWALRYARKEAPFYQESC
jgi:acyl-coenzyme A synthetase/AMP-(fatty) acid ligase